MLLHYLGKVNSSNLLQITTGKKIKKRLVGNAGVHSTGALTSEQP